MNRTLQGISEVIFPESRGTSLVEKQPFFTVNNGKMGTIAGILFVLWALLEPARLGLGYSGNLREKVSSMVGFLILSFVAIGVNAYLVLIQPARIPIEFALVGANIVFLGAEILFGIYTTRVFVKLQNRRFYLQVANMAHEHERNQRAGYGYNNEEDEGYGVSNAYGEMEVAGPDEDD